MEAGRGSARRTKKPVKETSGITLHHGFNTRLRQLSGKGRRRSLAAAPGGLLLFSP